MSGVNQPQVGTSAPSAAPGTGTSGADGAADAYRRAVQARPTSFAENPIGRMASAVDRIGKAAGTIIHGREVGSPDSLAASEERLKRASDAVRANPQSGEARKQQLGAALALLRDMKDLAPNDPRKVKLAGFAVRLANQLGVAGLSIPGLDARGLLRMAAQITSRFGDAAGMQAAFQLEGVLKESLPQSSVEAVRARTQLLERLGIGPAASAALTNTWSVRLAKAGEIPTADLNSRTLVLDAQQENPSLSALARAYWHDTSMANPADKDGFMAAFLKIANQGGFAMLTRKYRDLQRLARHELSSQRAMAGPAAPAARGGDESVDMFAAVAVFARTHPEQLPEAMQPALQRFYS